MMLRRHAFCLLAAIALASSAAAQTPIQLTVAFPAGAGTDVNARIFAEALKDALGQPVIVMNRGGASGTIGSRAVATAAPDGTNLGFLTSVPITLQPHLMKLDMAPADFTPICRVTQQPTTLIASPKSGLRTLEDVLAKARSAPGKLTLGVPGLHSGPHLVAIEFLKEANLDIVVVPHQADNNAVQPLITGEIDLAFAAPSFGPSNGFEVLAVSSRDRVALIPDVPTFTERGFPIVNSVSVGLMGPKGLRPEVTARLETACRTVMDDPSYRQRMATAGVPLAYAPAAEYAKQLADEWTSMKAAAERLPPKQ